MTTIDVNMPYNYYNIIIVEWCFFNIGPPAKSLNDIDVDHPWYENGGLQNYHFHFFNENDATLFKLRWVNELFS